MIFTKELAGHYARGVRREEGDLYNGQVFILQKDAPAICRQLEFEAMAAIQIVVFFTLWCRGAPTDPNSGGYLIPPHILGYVHIHVEMYKLVQDSLEESIREE